MKLYKEKEITWGDYEKINATFGDIEKAQLTFGEMGTVEGLEKVKNITQKPQ